MLSLVIIVIQFVQLVDFVDVKGVVLIVVGLFVVVGVVFWGVCFVLFCFQLDDGDYDEWQENEDCCQCIVDEWCS